jgi:hypothetical protein
VTARKEIKAIYAWAFFALSCEDLHADANEECWFGGEHSLFEGGRYVILCEKIHGATE